MILNIDLGRYEIAYTVLNDDNQIELFSLSTMSNTLEDVVVFSSKTFITKVIAEVRLLIKEYGISTVKFTLPSNNLLVEFNSVPSIKDIRNYLVRVEKINISDGVEVLCGFPYWNKNKFYVPIILYDSAIDLLVKDLNINEESLQYEDDIKCEVEYTSSLQTILKIYNTFKFVSDCVIIDAGYLKSTIYKFKSNVLVDINEIYFSGRQILSNIASASKDVEKAIEFLTKEGADDLIGVQSEFKKYEQEFQKELRDVQVVYLTGGLSHLNWSKHLSSLNKKFVNINLPGLKYGKEEEPNIHKYCHTLYQGNNILTNKNIDSLDVYKKLGYQKNLDVEFNKIDKVKRVIYAIIEEEEIRLNLENIETKEDALQRKYLILDKLYSSLNKKENIPDIVKYKDVEELTNSELLNEIETIKSDMDNIDLTIAEISVNSNKKLDEINKSEYPYSDILIRPITKDEKSEIIAIENHGGKYYSSKTTKQSNIVFIVFFICMLSFTFLTLKYTNDIGMFTNDIFTFTGSLSTEEAEFTNKYVNVMKSAIEYTDNKNLINLKTKNTFNYNKGKLTLTISGLDNTTEEYIRVLLRRMEEIINRKEVKYNAELEEEGSGWYSLNISISEYN